MKPHNYAAPGLPVHYQKIIHRKQHVARFRGNEVSGCTCGKVLDGEGEYRAHLKTKGSYLTTQKKETK